MKQLSIEELKDVVANAKTSLEQYLALELIALKGEQVPVGFTSESALDDVADSDTAIRLVTGNFRKFIMGVQHD